MPLRLLAKIMVMVAFVALPVEIGSYLFSKVLMNRHIMVSLPDNIDYEAYLSIRDPLLGWPPPSSFGSDNFDSTGSRIVPSHPDPSEQACIELYGDSFVWGDDVSASEAFGNVLAQNMDCRVANYGIPGYGTDQSFLRYRERPGAKAPIVILGFWTENIVRNVNRYRGFLAPNADLGFKPRFIVSDITGELILIPMPEPEHTALRTFELENDWFAPGAGGGVIEPKFPFTVAVLRSMTHFKISAAVHRQPSYAPFYDSNHKSDALRTTIAIMNQFQKETSERGQRGIILIMPSNFDIDQIRSTNSAYHAPLLTALTSLEIEYLDVSRLFVNELEDRSSCAVYMHCGGHFSPEGNRLLARYILEYVRPLSE